MIYVVGLGPGNRSEMTARAMEVLESCDVIVGYKGYVDLIADLFAHKDLRAYPMKGEVARCRDALDLALSGKTVGLVSSGDPGIYGMAGIMLEVADGQVDVEVVPGVTAAGTVASILGAPLMHDFAVVSLSDLLTPWDLITKRLAMAAEADFVLCIYNPSSHGRAGHFKRACEILMEHRAPETPAGWVRNAGREGEAFKITTLGEIGDEALDMFCTVVIGNSTTVVLNGRMVTPRGYLVDCRMTGEDGGAAKP